MAEGDPDAPRGSSGATSTADTLLDVAAPSSTGGGEPRSGELPADDHRLGAELGGSGRFRIDRVLGSGGMGVVYQAFDHDAGVPVALKTLKNWGAQELYRLKNEFRQLAEVRHPNLVQLRELVCEEGTWFVSMELVRGTDFLSHVRASGAPVDPASDTPDGRPQLLHDARRLSEATLQTATALHELHERGKVHRDLKPHNVLVTPSGRVVVLDFGLVSDATQGDAASGIIGTPGYMAPEQVSLVDIGPPADLYALGVMLYEALTGRLPFMGTPYQVLIAKETRDPPAPSSLRRGIDPAWESLCLALLRRDPRARPTARDVLSALGAIAIPAPPEPGLPFVGREGELATLSALLEATRKGQPILAHVEGSSGVGKSTLIKQFLQGLPEAAHAVLVARCYERESIPYKAVDGLVDSLARHLVRLGPEAAALLPRDIHALTRVFPVLLRADAVARAPHVGSPSPDAQELRRRAFASFKELLGRLADRKRLVLWVDDVQWDDADSAALLSNALSSPDPPALLLIATCRREESGQSASVQALRRALAPDQVHDVPVDPLTAPQAAELALRLMGAARATRERSEQIARESEGNPLFVGALAQRTRDADPQHFPSLAELLRARVESLPRASRRLLEVLVVEGRPVAQVQAFRAARLGPEGREALAVLRAASLARTGGSSEHDSADVFHGRIRDVVAASMDPERTRECHAELARALEAAEGPVDHERMAMHLFAAGDVQRAALHARSAGDEAARALAFDRAVDFYRQALAGTDEGRSWELETRLAVALANTGRTGEAGDRYLAAARASPPQGRTALLKEAAFHLLSSGRASEGMTVAREALAAVGMWMPATPRHAFVSLTRNRARLRARGLRYRPADPRSISARTRTRIDLCWSLALGLLNVDFVRSNDFATRGLLLALESGDPFRVGRALLMEINAASSAGASAQLHVDALLAIADEHAERLREPYLRGFGNLVRGISHFWRAEWGPSATHLVEGARLMAEIPGTSFEVVVSETIALLSHYLAGDVDEMLRGVAALRVRVQPGADLYLQFRMIDVSHLESLVLDRPGRAREDIAETIEDRVHKQGDGGPFFVWLLLQARVRIALYEGKGAEAHRLMAERGPELEQSLLLRPPLSGIIYNHLLGLATIAATDEGTMTTSEAETVLERTSGALRAVDMPFARAAHASLEAGLASIRGDTSRIADALDRAIEEFDRAGMAVFAASARRRRGELGADDARRAQVRDADAWMRSRSIRDPDRMARTCVPALRRG